MKYLICYDIPETKIRNKVVKCLKNFSYRLQYSVFLGEGTSQEIMQVKVRLRNYVLNSPNARILIVPLTEENLNNWWMYGSVIEEKIALGNCVLICKVKEIYELKIKEALKNYQITTIVEKDINYSFLFKNIKRIE